MKPNTCINVWRFDDAPAAYKKLSDHGGDEDWVVFIPAGIECLPLEIDTYYVQGWGHVCRAELADGAVLIFAHA